MSLSNSGKPLLPHCSIGPSFLFIFFCLVFPFSKKMRRTATGAVLLVTFFLALFLIPADCARLGRGKGGAGSRRGRPGAKASVDANACLTARARTFEGFINAGNEQFSRGDYAKAFECYEVSLSLTNSKTLLLRFSLTARLFFCLDEQLSTTADPGQALGWNNLGLSEMYLGKSKEAVSHLQKAVRFAFFLVVLFSAEVHLFASLRCRRFPTLSLFR